MIENFVKRVGREELNLQEKDIVAQFTDKAKNLEKILSSLQMIIFFLQNTHLSNEIFLCDMVINLPDFVYIENELRNFLNENPHLQLKKMISIYEYLEFLCFSKILENVHYDYKEKLTEDEKKLIDDYFSKHELFVSKLKFATATRRFISRYLIREEEINKNSELIARLIYKPDFWEASIYEDDRLLEQAIEMLTELKVSVRQAIDFYYHLGGDDQLKHAIIKKEKLKEEIKKIESKKIVKRNY